MAEYFFKFCLSGKISPNLVTLLHTHCPFCHWTFFFITFTHLKCISGCMKHFWSLLVSYSQMHKN